MGDPASEGVRRYFDRGAARFDMIYQQEKGLLPRLVDRLFRGVVGHRFRLTLDRCGDVSGLRVLDVGCGSGRYCVEFARRGAQVVGLDFAAGMVRMAADAAAAAGVASSCRFEQADFLTWTSADRFDVGLAMGFFDYVRPAAPFVHHLAQLVDGRVFGSFPVRWTFRTPSRWVRLQMSGCPVYFYDRPQVQALFATPAWSRCTVDRLSRDFLVEAHTS